MRKVDYELLATVIAAELETAREWGQRATRELDRDLGIEATVKYDATVRVARQFANHASVNKRAFLTACGIDPG